MAVVLAITGVAVAAFCIWLMVRIINRRERWAIDLALLAVVLAVLCSMLRQAWNTTH